VKLHARCLRETYWNLRDRQFSLEMIKSKVLSFSKSELFFVDKTNLRACFKTSVCCHSEPRKWRRISVLRPFPLLRVTYLGGFEMTSSPIDCLCVKMNYLWCCYCLNVTIYVSKIAEH